MSWPQVLDYNEAIQSPALCFGDADLRQGQPATNRLGWPMPCTGNFAAVYKVSCPGQRIWAVKCFTREVPELHQRYEAISTHLQRARQQAGLPFMVEFHYLDEGIRLQRRWYPILKMRWIEGLALNQFVKDSLARPPTLTALAELWLRLARDLRAAEIAHGDLQHGNVLLIPKQGGVNLKLIDYDGMFVQALANSRSGEVGHPNFQHPRRGDDPFHAEIDRFAHLVIYTALRCLAVAGPGLWDRYDNGENLLFREADFKRLDGSELFQELWKLPDAGARALVGHLIMASQGPPDQVARLDDLVGNGRQPLLSPAQERQVKKLLPTRVARARPRSRIPVSPVPVAKPPLSPHWWVSGHPATTSPPSKPPGGWRSTQPSISSPAPPVAPSPASPSPAAPRSSLRAWILGTAAFLLVGLVMGIVGYESGYYLDDLERIVKRMIGPTSSPAEKPQDDAKLPRRFTGHEDKVYSVAFSPDGRHALSGSEDQTVRLWDVDSGKELQRFAMPESIIYSVAFSPDGHRALFGSDDQSIRLWDVETGKELHRFDGHEGAVYSVAFSPDGHRALSGSDDQSIRLWDVETGQELRRFDGPKSAVLGVAFSPDGHRALSGSEDKTVRLWDVETGKELHRFDGHKGAVYSVAFSPDGRRALSGSEDKTVRLWDVESSKELLHFDGHTKAVNSVAFSPDGRRALSGSDDQSVRLWDGESGQELGRLDGYTGAVTSVAFSPDGRRALSASWDKTLQLWPLPKGSDAAVAGPSVTKSEPPPSR